MAELIKNKSIESSIMYADALMIAVAELESKALSECMGFLKGLLALNGGKIEFHEYDEDGVQIDDNSFCVSYDGGNHPEYDSNCFSEVRSVYIKDGEIYLDTEDCDEYSIKHVSDREIIEMCLYIYSDLMD